MGLIIQEELVDRLPKSISLSQFVDFVTARGVQKVNVVKRTLDQVAAGYSQHKDYYKKFRDAVVRLHQNGCSIHQLEEEVLKVADASRLVNYQILARGYIRCWATWIQEQSLTWCTPPSGEFSLGGLTVRVRPEVAFTDGRALLVAKLYLKQAELEKSALEIVLHLLQTSLFGTARGANFSVIDVRSGKLLSATKYDHRMVQWLRGEVLSWLEIAHQIQADAAVVEGR